MRATGSLLLAMLLVGCQAPSSVETLSLGDAISSLRVKGGHGKVTLAPSEDNTVSVTVTLTGKGTKYGYKIEDGELTLKKKCGFLNVGVCEVDFEILAPANAAAEIATDSGKISVSDWIGPLDLDTSSGDIDVAVTSGNLQASTNSGAISATDVSSNHVALVGGSGEVVLDVTEQEFEDILVDNGSGDVTVYLPASGSYDLSTDSKSGKIVTNNVSTSSNSTVSVDISTGSGDILVEGQ